MWILSAKSSCSAGQVAWAGPGLSHQRLPSVSGEPAFKTSGWALSAEGHPHDYGLGEDPNVVTQWLSSLNLRLWSPASRARAQAWVFKSPLHFIPCLVLPWVLPIEINLQDSPESWGWDDIPCLFPSTFPQGREFALTRHPLCVRHALCGLP